jgi:hypothetical protein
MKRRTVKKRWGRFRRSLRLTAKRLPESLHGPFFWGERDRIPHPDFPCLRKYEAAYHGYYCLPLRERLRGRFNHKAFL